MTARPPEPPHDDALSVEEREFAARLAKLDAGAGPSAALDARILAAARAARPASRRSVRRWPQALGAAAVLVAAIGLAWQLKPMFALPPGPIASEHAGAGTAGSAEADVVVQVERVPRVSDMAPATPAGDAAAQAAAPAAARKAAPTAGSAPAAAVADARRAPAAARTRAAAPTPAPPPAAPVAPMAAAASPPPPAPQAAARESDALDRVEVAGSRIANAAGTVDRLGNVGDDARLPLAEWLQRIRARRDAGDLDGARSSLARFVTTYPRARVPDDLQPLLRDGEPWAP